MKTELITAKLIDESPDGKYKKWSLGPDVGEIFYVNEKGEYWAKLIPPAVNEFIRNFGEHATQAAESGWIGEAAKTLETVMAVLKTVDGDDARKCIDEINNLLKDRKHGR